jgi:hypothetical protein
MADEVEISADLQAEAPVVAAEPVVTEAVVAAEPVVAVSAVSAPLADAPAVQAAPDLNQTPAPAKRGRKPGPKAAKAAAAKAALAAATTPVEPVVAKAAPVRKPRAAKVAKPKSAPARRQASAVAPVTPVPAAKPAPQAADMPAARRRASVKRTSSTLGTGKPKFSQFKEFTMATPIDFSKFQTVFADVQGKAKAAFEKGTAALGEADEFAKGNVEALVESGKVLSSGLQDLGATAVAETRGAFEALTTDAKELAAAKSPTEFFQLQSAIVRKQFDGAVAQASKNTEAFLKLANDAFAPLSSRVTLAVEKVSKVG